MISKYNNKFVISTFVVFAFFLSFATQTIAQQVQPQLIQLNLLEVKPEMLERFRAIHREVFMPSSRRAGVPWRSTNTTVLGNTLQIAVGLPIDNFAALDQPQTLGATPNEQLMALEIWRTAVLSRRSIILTSRPDLSMESLPAPGLISTYRIILKNGKNAEFESLWASRVIPALTQSGIQGTQVFQTVMGGNNTEYWSRTPLANYAALDAGGPFRGLSASDAAQLNADLGELIESVEINVNQTDQELSYGLPGLQQ